MLEILGKIFRSTLFIGMAILVGWLDYGVTGYMGIATNSFFAAIGGLLVHTWLSQRKKEYVLSSGSKSLVGPNIDANVAEPSDEIAKAELTMKTSTPQDTDAVETK
jgi:hypothetical protein